MNTRKGADVIAPTVARSHAVRAGFVPATPDVGPPASGPKLGGMVTPGAWDELEAWLGVTLTFAPTPSGTLTSTSPQAAARRSQGLDPVALADRLTSDLCALGVRATRDEAAVIVNVVADDAWLANVQVKTEPVTDRLTRLPHSELTRTYGLDQARWAWLAQASKSPTLDWGKPGAAWATRTDANPLAYVRRAYAAATLRLTHWADRNATVSPLPDAGLRQAVVGVAQASRQTIRTRRTRPLIESTHRLAGALLAQVETQPVERTDLQAVSTARTLVAHVASASDVTLPVPF